MDSLLGPISPIPRAMVDANGLPYKSTKSSTTSYIQTRYKNMQVVTNTFPPGWVPDVVILEGMFLVQTSPIPTLATMQEYVQFLITKFVRPHFSAGVSEVHVVFDSPGSLPETPKEIEQARRDQSSTKAPSVEHQCTLFQASEKVPNKWRAVLACRQCKKALTWMVAEEMLHLVVPIISPHQTFVTNIQEEAFVTTTDNIKKSLPSLWTNADEGDLRVWLHCIQSTGRKKLIFSPDTDVYHIGLTAMQHIPEAEVIVQLSKGYKEVPKFLHLKQLNRALCDDPDLADIPTEMRPQVLQSLYVSTGCDYVSFFAGIGKASFLATFFQHSSFIAKGDPEGSIGSLPSNGSIWSFLRLIGCAYFRRHKSAFEQVSPEALYNSIPQAKDIEDHHEQWLTIIRNIVWQRADSDNHTMPSTAALTLHWQRCLWVLGLWHAAVLNKITLPGKSTNV